jgi:hypothetical protein
MKVSRQALAWLLALALPIAAGCDIIGSGFQEQESETWSRSYPLQAGGRVEVTNVNGRIHVAGTDGATVEVTAEKIGKGSSPEAAREALQRIEIREDTAPDRIRLETRLPSSAAMFHRGGGEVRYTLRVPSGAHVRLQTVNGGVEVRNVAGRTHAETTNGGIEARGLSGPVDVSTTNGGVDVEVDAVAGDGIRMECTNGGLRLRLPKEAKAEVSARITNGGISVVDLPLEIIGEQSRRRLDGRLNGGGPRVRIEGTNGGVRLSGK